jgi:hypothetical protein
MTRLAVLTAAMLVVGAVGAEAQSPRCRVMDPTGTPLNLRDRPNGGVLGQVRNGTLVESTRIASDERGRPWAYIVDRNSGEPLGWVFREFIACF